MDSFTLAIFVVSGFMTLMASGGLIAIVFDNKESSAERILVEKTRVDKELKERE